MRVKILAAHVTVPHPKGGIGSVALRGEIVDVPDGLAARWKGLGAAESVPGRKPKTERGE